MARGMPTKFTPSIRAKILYALENGNYMVTTCAALGIAQKTYYRWLERARDYAAKAEEGYELTAEEATFVKFLSDVEQASAKSEQQLIAKVLELGDHSQDWKAYMTILERRFSKRWGRGVGANTVTVSTEDGQESKGIEIKVAFEPAAVLSDDDTGRGLADLEDAA